jgi:hypothetical protein
MSHSVWCWLWQWFVGTRDPELCIRRNHNFGLQMVTSFPYALLWPHQLNSNEVEISAFCHKSCSRMRSLKRRQIMKTFIC